MRNVSVALCGAFWILAVGGGCHPPMRVDYSKFDQQCPAWQALWHRGDDSAQFVAESKGVEAYYEYNMCLEMMYVRQPDTERMQYLLDHAKEFVRIIPDKLRNPRHWKELYVLSRMLWRMHMHKYYNVGADKDLMNVWRESIQIKNKYHSGFNDSMYFDVEKFSY